MTEKPDRDAAQPDRFAKLPGRVKPEDMTTSQAEPPPPFSAVDSNDEDWQQLRNIGG